MQAIERAVETSIESFGARRYSLRSSRVEISPLCLSGVWSRTKVGASGGSPSIEELVLFPQYAGDV